MLAQQFLQDLRTTRILSARAQTRLDLGIAATIEQYRQTTRFAMEAEMFVEHLTIPGLIGVAPPRADEPPT